MSQIEKKESSPLPDTPKETVVISAVSQKKRRIKPEKAESPVPKNLSPLAKMSHEVGADRLKSTIQSLKGRIAERKEKEFAKSKTLPTLLYNERKLFLPSEVITEDNPLVGSIIHYARLNEFQVYEYKYFTDEELKTTKFVHSEKSVYLGIFVGCTDKTYFKLDLGKTEVERGRAMVFGLRVKKYFEKQGSSQYLRKNNCYFGNDVAAGLDNRNPRTYFWKEYMRNYYSDFPDLSLRLGEILYKFITKECFAFYSKKLIIKSVKAYAIPFTEIIKAHYQPVIENTGRKRGKVKSWRKPNKISSSPLLLPGELKLIWEFYNPVWDTLSTCETTYEDSLNKGLLVNAKEFADTVRYIFSQRWQIVTGIAKLTKTRLEAIRKIATDYAKFKKKEVSRIALSRYLLNEYTREGRVTFAKQVFSIYKDSDWVQSMFCKRLKDFAIPNVSAYLNSQWMQLLQSEKIVTLLTVTTLREIPEVVRTTDEELSKLLPLVETTFRRIYSISILRNRIDYKNVGGFNLHNRLVIRDLVSNTSNAITALEDVNPEKWAAAAEYLSMSPYNNLKTVIDLLLRIRKIIAGSAFYESVTKANLNNTPTANDFAVFSADLERVKEKLGAINFTSYIQVRPGYASRRGQIF